MTEVICSFINKCRNYNRECDHCRWNSNCNYGDYLVLKTEDGREIHYLDMLL